MTGTGMFASAEAYDRFVGRYGPSLAAAHVAAAEIAQGQRVLDVGCGPGQLTRALAQKVGSAQVAAVDPSPEFVDACRQRVPGADVRVGTAERLPSYDPPFDVVMSQLVLNFMADAETGVQSMRAATRDGGLVTSCVWDYADGMTMLRAFWDAALDVDADAPDESRTMKHCTPDALAALWERCGLDQVETSELRAESAYDGFDDLWAPFLAGVGPAGAYCAALDPDRQAAVRERYFERLGAPSGSFVLGARAWFVRGRV